MGSKVLKSSFSSAFTKTYASQAAPSPKQHSYSLPHHQPKVSTLGNGAVVVAHENNSPVARLAVFARSGSRYETNENWGVSHYLRLMAGQKTENYSKIGLTRITQQLGGFMVCEGGREHISYQITTLRDDVEQAFDLISNVGVLTKFRHWEMDDQQARLKTELELVSRCPTAQVLDLLHKAAFRNTGLGNSIYIPHFRAGTTIDKRVLKIQPEQLEKFYKETHSGPRLAFVGLGIPHTYLEKLAKQVPAGSGAGPSSPSTYSGGEIRHEDGSSLAHVALAGPGAKLGSEEAVSLAIAQFILGGNPGTKYGDNSSGKLSAIIAGAGGSGSASAINVSYTDSGLFGFMLTEDSKKVGDVVKALAKGIRTLKVTDQDVKNAKTRAKAAILMASESSDGELEEMGLQAIFTGGYVSPLDMITKVDQVTAASVQSALTNAAKGKPSLVSVGGVYNVPYIDQL